MKKCFRKFGTLVGLFAPWAALLMGASGPNLRAAPFSDLNWASMGGYPGADGTVRAAVTDGSGNLYIGGSFSVVGDVSASSVAKWDGTNWSAVGLGVNAGVYALAIAGGDLYAAGYFTIAGGKPANYIAKWDGTNWSALGAGMNGSGVFTLAVSGGDVYAGGTFTTAGGSAANHIARWDGSSWSPLGTGINGTVDALEALGGDLYAGGVFTKAGGSNANYIAKWNGTNWSALGSGMNNWVSALAASGSDLYAGGGFTTAGGSAVNYIAKWNGSNWSALGPFPPGISGIAWAMTVAGNDLYVGGGVPMAGGSRSNYIAKWNGSSWSPLSSGVSGYATRVYALVVSGGDLFATGQFTTADGSPVWNIAKWNGSSWIPPSSGLNGGVSALVASGNDVYAGGGFTIADGNAANCIAKWNGSSWSALGSGLNSNVSALALSGSDLYAGGQFTMAGSSAAKYVAKWDGTNWSPLGSGLNSNVWALAASGSDLYAGGEFTTAGGMAANHVAKWNGSGWSPLGSGVSAPAGYPYYGGRVTALAVLGSDLYAGGYFTNAGGIAANYIAKWDGSTWSALGSGMGGGYNDYPYVFALAVSGSDLYAGGGFTTAGGNTANRIAKWNGSSWGPLGSGTWGNEDYSAVIRALTVSGGDVYAAGWFSMAGGNWANHIAKWNGSGWSRLGSGLNGAVGALAMSGSDLYAGGSFTTAGTKVSAYVARADLDLPVEPPFADVTATVAPDLQGVAGSSVAWADYDHDGRLDFLLTGTSFENAHVSQIWRNTGTGFTNATDAVAPGLQGGGVAWVDYDDDGWVDFMVANQLWRNTGSGFANVTTNVGLAGFKGGRVAWGDYDNDGRPDFLAAGAGGFVSQIWRNTENGFTNVTATVAPALTGVVSGSVAWSDFDNDGRLDFLLTGGIRRRSDLDDYISLSGIAQLWRNTGSNFVNVTDTVAPGLPGVFSSSVAWADYDNDGWQDFVLTGFNFGFSGEEVSAFLNFSQIWRNTGHGFVNVTETVAPGLPAVQDASVAWGDYDNDGRLDLFLTTFPGSQIWRNTESGFVNVTASIAPGLPPLTDSSVAWGDYDNDGRLDLLLTGAVEGQCEVCDAPPRTSQLWRNQIGGANPSPAVITAPPTSVSQTSVTLHARINPMGDTANAWFVWGDSTNYGNVTTPQPMGNGNSFTNFSEMISGLSAGVTYYFRAVGSNEQGQVSFGFEQHFTLTPAAVTTGVAGNLSPPLATLNGYVNPNNLPAHGWFEWGLTPALGQTTSVRLFSAGLGGPLTLNVSNLQGGTTHHYRAVVSNSFGVAYGAMRSFVTPTFANVTSMVTPELAQVGYASVTWGDYDNDGRMDFILSGYLIDGENDAFLSQLWRNTLAGFTNVTATVAPDLRMFGGSQARWADYDNDGRLDLLTLAHMGHNTDPPNFQLWRNTTNGFTNVTATFGPRVLQDGSGSAWGDYDNDGRPDLIIGGIDENGDFVTQLWRNTESGFSNVTAELALGIPGVIGLQAAWGDYDHDGWFDFLLTGTTNSPSGHSGQIAQLWRNTGFGFTNVTAAVAPGLPGVLGMSAWADYDNDGKLDFLIVGWTNQYQYQTAISQIWRNTGSGFTNVTAALAPSLPGVGGGSAAWGDYDNDGRPDFLISGNTINWDSRISQVWRNTESGFENVTAIIAPGLPQLSAGSVAWGDYNNDGRLDFLFTGQSSNRFISQLWQNHTPVTNTPPSAPTGLAMTASSNAVMLSWNSATDAQTPANGLSYNVRAGTAPGGNDLLSAHVDATNGFRRVPAMGNAMLRHSLPLTGLTNGQTVYWSVQSVDTAFAGGPFATETSVVSLPQLSLALDSQPSTLKLSWSPPTFGWVLQQSTNLGGNHWTPAPGDNSNSTAWPATNGAQFFRLRQP